MADLGFVRRSPSQREPDCHRTDYLPRRSSLGGRVSRRRRASTPCRTSDAALFASFRGLARYWHPLLCYLLRHFAPCTRKLAANSGKSRRTYFDGGRIAGERVLERPVFPLALFGCQLCCVRSLCASCRLIDGSSHADLSFRRWSLGVLLDLSPVCDLVGLSLVATQHPECLTSRFHWPAVAELALASS